VGRNRRPKGVRITDLDKDVFSQNLENYKDDFGVNISSPNLKDDKKNKDEKKDEKNENNNIEIIITDTNENNMNGLNENGLNKDNKDNKNNNGKETETKTTQPKKRDLVNRNTFTSRFSSVIRKSFTFAPKKPKEKTPPKEGEFNVAPRAKRDRRNRNTIMGDPDKITTVDNFDNYQTSLDISLYSDLSHLDKYKMAYKGGVDFSGRPIIVIIACHLPIKEVDNNEIIYYFLKVMNEVVKRDYVVVYIHSNFRSDNKPTIPWLRKCLNLITRDYKKKYETIIYCSIYILGKNNIETLSSVLKL